MKRNTIQRSLVLEAVRQLKNHPTADEVYAAIVPRHPDISKATVYRNLSRLAEEGIICRRMIPGEPDRFDHICTHHYHIRCQQCGGVFDADMDYIDDLAHNIRDRHGFLISSHDIFFSGVCPDCQKKG